MTPRSALDTLRAMRQSVFRHDAEEAERPFRERAIYHVNEVVSLATFVNEESEQAAGAASVSAHFLETTDSRHHNGTSGAPSTEMAGRKTAPLKRNETEDRMGGKKLRIGATLLTLWRQCPKQWAYRQRRVPRGPSDMSALVFGSAIHEALEFAHSGLCACTVNGMLKAYQDYQGDNGKIAPGWNVERARRIFRALGQFPPFRHQVGAEVKVGADLDDHTFFSGTIDRLDDRGDGETVVVDYKTGKPKRQAWADEAPQASAYLWATRASAFEFWYLEHGLVLRTSRTDKQLDEFEYWMRDVAASMHGLLASGDAGTAQPSALCPWCSWSHLCDAYAQ